MRNTAGGEHGGLGNVMVILATLGLVVGAAAGALRGLDALAGALHGEPRGVKRYASIEEAEAKVRARLLLPAYFPDTLQWPPAVVRLAGGPVPAVALTFVGRERSGPQLHLYQAFGRAGPTELLPPRQLLHATVVGLDGAEGRLSRIVGEDGEIWHELAWEGQGRQIVLRFRGPADELLRMARSMGRGRP